MVNVVADRLSRVEVDLVKSGTTKTATICSQTLRREFAGLQEFVYGLAWKFCVKRLIHEIILNTLSRDYPLGGKNTTQHLQDRGAVNTCLKEN